MHDDQVPVSAELAARLVARQFPQWGALAIRPVRSTGTVHAIFRVGTRRSARFPLRLEPPAAARARLERERLAAVEFADLSPFPCPEPVAIGDPDDGYPMSWAVQTWVPGVVALDVAARGAADAVAADLARLIAALRVADTHGRRFAGDGRGGGLTEHDDWLATCFERSELLVDVSPLRQLWEDLRTLPRAGPDVMAHGDLMPGNLLVRDDRLVGVIDTGDFGPADRALDLVCAWHLFDAGPRDVLRECLGCGDVEWRRGMAWALQQAMGLVWYYHRSHPVVSRIGQRTLARIAAAAE
jgi:aminoglycoside phosphotransferase (APT) family kinase protein